MRVMETEMMELLREFVAFRTIVGEDATKAVCLDWIQNNFLSLHTNIERGESDGTPYLYLAHSDPKLLWFAHIDVVPAPEKLFSTWREGDRIRGRGVKDMKGAALPFLLAFRDACKAGSIPPVSILLTSDEEIGGRTIPNLLECGIIPGAGLPRTGAPRSGTTGAWVAFTPDTGSASHIVTEHKGGIWADLIAHGRGAHAGLPWEGENPIFLLAEAISMIQKAFPAGSASDWHITVSPTKLQGSDAKNKIPDVARCSLDIRYPGTAYSSADAALADIIRILPDGCSMEVSVTLDPLSTDANHPMVRRVQRLACDVVGEKISIGREHGATDARHFSTVNIPAFLYGPMGGALHQDDEWVSMRSLLHQYEISWKLLQELSLLVEG